jgi:hypothetical protein
MRRSRQGSVREQVRFLRRNQRFPAMAQLLVNRDGHGLNPQAESCGQRTRRRCRSNARGVSVTPHADRLQCRLPDLVRALTAATASSGPLACRGFLAIRRHEGCAAA